MVILDNNMIDSVVYKQWVSVDRCTLETVTKTDEFMEWFCKKLLLLLPHSFIATQQSFSYQDCKSALQPGELVVTADFSENYSFILQDAAHGFHRNNSQATIHSFVAYCIDSRKLSSELCSYFWLSASWYYCCLLFSKSLIAYLKRKFPHSFEKFTTFIILASPLHDLSVFWDRKLTAF